MKPTHPLSLRMLTLGAALTTTAAAASDSWKANAAGDWNNTASWTGGNIPGSTAVLDSTDIATFGFTLTAGRIVTVDANRNIGGITFSNTSNFGYTLSSGSLKLSNGGLIQSTGATGAHTDTISSPIEIQGDGGTATFTNASTLATRLMNIGAVSGVSTATNTTVLTLNGTQSPSGVLETVVSGVISDGTAGGKLATVKDGAGTWTLNNASNTYSGGTEVKAGVLRITTAGALGAGPLTLATGSTVHFINNSNTNFASNVVVTGNTTISSTKVSGISGDISHSLGTLEIGTSTLTSVKFFNTNVGALTFGATTLTGVATFNTTFTSGTNQTTLTLGAITGTAATGITKTGTGTMFLSGNSPSYAGTTQINAGTLQAGTGGATGDLGSGAVDIAAGATLAIARNNTATFTNAITGAGNVRVTSGVSSVVTFTNASHTGTTFHQNGILQTNNTASNIVLGTAGSTFTYPVLGLVADFTGGLGTAPGNISWAAGNNTSGGFTVMDAATRSVNIGGNPTPDTLTLGTGGFVGGTLSGNNSRLAIGDVNGTALGTVDFKNSINLGAGTRSLIIVANGEATAVGDLSGNITGSGLSNGTDNALVKFGNGNLRLSGENTYSGRTLVGGQGAVILNSAASFSANTWMHLDGGAAATLGGILGLGHGDLNADLGQSGGQVHFATTGGFAAFGANRSVTLNGGAPLTWASTTSFVGNAQNLILGQAKADGKITLTNSIDLNAATRAVQVNNGTAAVDGELSGDLSNGALTKAGAGTLILSGNSSYIGATTVSAGTLLVNGSLGDTAVSVGATATLGGTGSIEGTVSINGTLAPGASIGSLATGSLSFLTASTLAYEMNPADAGLADLVAANGQLALEGTVTLSILGADLAGWTLNDKITLISYFDIDGLTPGWNGGLFAGIADDAELIAGSNTWLFNYNDTTGGSNFIGDQASGPNARFVTMTLIPEPSALVLASLSAIALLRRRRH
jgi:autotransporter-associated beta strand protein